MSKFSKLLIGFGLVFALFLVGGCKNKNSSTVNNSSVSVETSSSNVTNSSASTPSSTVSSATSPNSTANSSNGSSTSTDSSSSSSSSSITSSISTAVNLTEIRITSQPTKTSYYAGDNLDTTGLEVTAYYSNNTTHVLSASEYSINKSTNLQAGDEIIVAFSSCQVSLNITITAVVVTSIEITTQPTKVNYYVGENFDATGMVVTGHFNNNTQRALSSEEYTISKTNDLQATDKIYVRSNGKEAQVNTTITAVTLIGIEITTQPTKTTYNAGDSLDTTGMVVSVLFSNDYSRVLTSSEYTINKTTNLQPSDVIKVSYLGEEDTIDITINAVTPTAIEVTTLPNKTVYYTGDNLSTYGMVVTAHFSQIDDKVISLGSNGYSISKTSNLQPGDEIIISYMGLQTRLNVTINAIEIVSIAVTKTPSKLDYVAGQTFNPSGIEVKATYNSGSISSLLSSEYTFDKTVLAVADQKVTVSCGLITTTIDITVVERAVTNIKIVTGPTKAVYSIGETFDPTGMVVEAIYNDDSKETITDYTYSPMLALQATDTEITLNYGTFSAKQAISVQNLVYFSEYGEGTQSNRWVEIYNNSGATIDLHDYAVARYANGASQYNESQDLFTFPESTLLEQGKTFVLYNSAIDTKVKNFVNGCSVGSKQTMSFNGDDAIGLFHGTQLIDVIGKIGEDPGSSWSGTAHNNVATTTEDVTLVRMTNTASLTFNFGDWNSYSADTFKYISSHLFNEGVPVSPACSVIYNANEGSGTMTDPLFYDIFAAATILDCSFVGPTGKIFKQWNTQADGKGEVVGTSLKLTGTVNIYAIWEDAFTITYHANGGSGTTVDSNIYRLNDQATIMASSFVAAENKVFHSWNTKDDGSGAIVPVGSIYTMSDNYDFYAIWVNINDGFKVSWTEASDEIDHGTFTVTGVTNNGYVIGGTMITVNVTPSSGYRLSTYTISGNEPVNQLGNASFVLTINAATSFTVQFAEVPTVLTAIYNFGNSATTSKQVSTALAADATSYSTYIAYQSEGSNANIVSSIASTSKAFPVASSAELKFGSSSAGGVLELALDKQYYISKVVVSAKKYGSDTPALMVNEVSGANITTSYSEITIEIEDTANSLHISSGAKRLYINYIKNFYSL